MKEQDIKLVVGALLHDIGKVVYRQGGDKRNHSASGHDYLKDNIGIKDKEILNSVKYHHSDMLRNSSLEKDDLSYIVYVADNIASATDRRDNGTQNYGFEMTAPLQSVFNILNGNNECLYYQPGMLNPNGEINYPQKEKKLFEEHFYSGVLDRITDNLKGIEYNTEYINSLLQILEATMSYVPSSTSKEEVADISLYDHVKLTAAVALCIKRYLESKNVSDYNECLFRNSKEFCKEDVFMLLSLDVSGIQNFIYTITSKNALRTLRARSFYLEIMMEHMVDCMLDELELTRANLIYSGGGHSYIIVPNTEQVRSKISNYMESMNTWLLDHYDVKLYVGYAYAPCSSNSLKNEPAGSYAKIYETISREMSKKKSNRYSAQQIIQLNQLLNSDYTRECCVCKKIGAVDENGVCSTCKSIEILSNNVLYGEFFSVVSKECEHSLPLPGGYYLVYDDESTLRNRMEKDDTYIRSYSKNRMFTGKHISTKLWVGDYTTGKSFADMASDAQGIERIGILRADVDNLGQTFVAGFKNSSNDDKYVTLSRTATLSRQLSLFFKLHLNQILRNSGYSLKDDKEHKRNATIVYSGGDDLFIVGAWNDIYELAIDIKNEFKKFTQGTLTISAGIGIYDAGYPISVSAKEVEELEDLSKKLPGKDAVTLLPDGIKRIIKTKEQDEIEISDGTYSWTELEDKVFDEKYKAIYTFFDNSDERGKVFLYNLLELIRGAARDKINFARYVYVLSRLEPAKDASADQKQLYREFADKMYQWIKSPEDRRHLKTAITLYAYLTRKKEMGD